MFEVKYVNDLRYRFYEPRLRHASSINNISFQPCLEKDEWGIGRSIQIGWNEISREVFMSKGKE